MPDKKSRIPSVRPKDDDDEPSTSRSSKPTGSFRSPQSSAPRGSSRQPPASSAPKSSYKPSLLSKVTSAYPKSSRPNKVAEDDDDEPPPGSDSDEEEDSDDEEEEDEVDEPPAHKTNKSALPTNLQRDKGKSIVATNLFRDKKSSAPASTQLNRDKKTALPATQLNRDKTESRRPDSRREGQASVKPKTIAGGSASIKPKTVAFGNATITKSLAFTDAKSIMEDEKIMKSVRSTVPLKSLATLATAHSNRASMTPKEKTKHDKDVTETNKGLDPCPEAFQFNRVSGGYVCSRGGHGMTDEMLEEGMGAICAFEQDELFKWSMKRGPYYKTEKGWAFNPYRKFKEVQKPRKHGGP